MSKQSAQRTNINTDAKLNATLSGFVLTSSDIQALRSSGIGLSHKYETAPLCHKKVYDMNLPLGIRILRNCEDKIVSYTKYEQDVEHNSTTVLAVADNNNTFNDPTSLSGDNNEATADIS